VAVDCRYVFPTSQTALTPSGNRTAAPPRHTPGTTEATTHAMTTNDCSAKRFIALLMPNFSQKSKQFGHGIGPYFKIEKKVSRIKRVRPACHFCIFIFDFLTWASGLAKAQYLQMRRNSSQSPARPDRPCERHGLVCFCTVILARFEGCVTIMVVRHPV